MSNVTLPSARIPLTADGKPISREWYVWAQDLTSRAGGVSSRSLGQANADIASIAAAAESLAAEVQQAPMPMQVLPQEYADGAVAALMAEIDELRRRVEALEAAPE